MSDRVMMKVFSVLKSLTLAFLALLVDPATGERRIDRADDIISATLVCIDGAPVRTREASIA